MSSKIKTRTYTFALTVEDTPNIEKIKSIVEQYYKWAWILHDKDQQPDGTPKKNHIHFYVDFENPRFLSGLAKDLGISENFIEKVHSKKAILNYFTHSNQPEKYQYDKSEIHTNFTIADETIDDAINALDMWHDFKKVKMGLLTTDDFITRYIVRHYQ